MSRLRSRDNHPPGGFRFTQPQTNWSAPEWRSFTSTVQAVIDHRLGNPAITAQHKLATDWDTVADEVDEFNAALCVAAEHYGFVQENNSPKLFPPRPFQPKDAAAGVRRTLAGISVVRDWLGDGLVPVSQQMADNRALICSTCPKNGEPNWLQRIDAKVAEYVHKLVEIRNDLKLSTPFDEQLHTCTACDCYLRVKVWTPIEHVLKGTSDETKKKLDPRCWVTAEQS